ncbi:hypothetical protein LOD99_5433 [Oopsacas minuta]|uniref:Uncharacterized protein n=1 Tax=Oopsacas minuta TaxID=111878 RepID=A0AAV7JR63_9METZ|nr:hypothetical protein LOD99_5433 [Oopsacas minuta]
MRRINDFWSIYINFCEEDIERNIEYDNGVEMSKMPRKKLFLRNLQFLASFQIVQLISQISLDDKEEKRMQDV